LAWLQWLCEGMVERTGGRDRAHHSCHAAEPT
jgi:hypothetical protein